MHHLTPTRMVDYQEVELVLRAPANGLEEMEK